MKEIVDLITSFDRNNRQLTTSMIVRSGSPAEFVGSVADGFRVFREELKRDFHGQLEQLCRAKYVEQRVSVDDPNSGRLEVGSRVRFVVPKEHYDNAKLSRDETYIVAAVAIDNPDTTQVPVLKIRGYEEMGFLVARFFKLADDDLTPAAQGEM